MNEKPKLLWRSEKDTELWLYQKQEGIVIPVYIKDGKIDNQEIVQLTLANGIPSTVLEWFDKMLRSISCHIHEVVPHYYIHKKPFLLSFDKAHGINPGFYAKYGIISNQTPSEAIWDEVQKECPGDSDNFIKEIWHSTDAFDLDTMKAVWALICQEAPRWMIGKNKSINMGWCKLHAVQYRANWKQILLSRFPLVWSILRGVKEKGPRANIQMSDLYSDLLRSDLVATKKTVRGKVIFCWTAELEMLKDWHEYSEKVESEISTSMPDAAYARRLGLLNHRCWWNHILLFRSFVEDTLLPCGAAITNDAGILKKLAQNIPKGRVRPNGGENNNIHPVSFSDKSGLIGPGEGETLSGEGPNMPHQMPDVCDD